MTLTTADLVDRAQTGGVDEIDDTENPAPRPKRRSFTAEEKLAHLDPYEALPKGESGRGSYLRRERLYSSHICEWRKQRDAGTLTGAAKGRRPKRSAEQVELERLRRSNARLESELDRTKTALEITGKVHALLESISESADNEPKSKP